MILCSRVLSFALLGFVGRSTCHEDAVLATPMKMTPSFYSALAYFPGLSCNARIILHDSLLMEFWYSTHCSLAYANFRRGKIRGEHALPDRRLVVGTELWQLPLRRIRVRCSLAVVTPAVHGVTAKGVSISNMLHLHKRRCSLLGTLPSKNLTISTGNDSYILCLQLGQF